MFFVANISIISNLFNVIINGLSNKMLSFFLNLFLNWIVGGQNFRMGLSEQSNATAKKKEEINERNVHYAIAYDPNF